MIVDPELCNSPTVFNCPLTVPVNVSATTSIPVYLIISDPSKTYPGLFVPTIWPLKVSNMEVEATPIGVPFGSKRFKVVSVVDDAPLYKKSEPPLRTSTPVIIPVVALGYAIATAPLPAISPL